MTLWYCKAPQKPASAREASARVRRLLRAACLELCGEEPPELAKTEQGRPYFPEWPRLFVSLSHSGPYLLCALAHAPVGCDVQERRALRAGMAGKLMDEREREAFDFFELWTLRESLLKMRGYGDLRYERFRRESGAIISVSEPQARFRLFAPDEDCVCALCLPGAEPCGGLRQVAFELL